MKRIIQFYFSFFYFPVPVENSVPSVPSPLGRVRVGFLIATVSKLIPFFFFFVLILHFSAVGQAFKLVTKATGLPALGNSKMAVGDVDNDNDIDVLISGSDNGGNKITAIYENKGDTSFVNLGAAITALDKGDLAFADVNNDNFLDFIITGTNNSQNISLLYINNGNKTFSLSTQRFDSVAYSSVQWFDYDRDGDEDLFVSGRNNANQKLSRIYRNTGKGNFSLVTATGIVGFTDGGVAIADFNNDHLDDIFISGLDATNFNIAYLYYQLSDGKFTAQNFAFTGLINGSIVAIDYNSDGMMDIALTGADNFGNLQYKIYKNVADGSAFVDVPNTFTGIINGSQTWADFDNDGDQDVVITGYDGVNPLSEKSTTVYTNSSNTFTSLATLKDLEYSDVKWIDMDNDHDLDVLLSGFSLSGPLTYLYRNNITTIGISLASPTNLIHLAIDDSVNLSWNAPLANATPQKALTYNLWLSSSKDSFTVVSPAADLLSGYFRKVEYGKYTSTTTGWIKNLDEKKYYWQVQALDNSYRGSPFSVIDSFVVCKTLKPIVKDTAICFGNTIAVKSGIAGETVSWKATRNGNTTVSGFNYSQLITQTDTLISTRINALGCVRYDTFKVKMNPLPLVSLPQAFYFCKKSAYAIAQGTPSDTVSWYSNEGFLIKANTITGIANMKDSLWVKIISQYGCSNRDTVVVDTLSLPQFSLGADTAVCKGQELLTLTINRTDTILWYNSSTVLGTASILSLPYLTKADTIFAKVKNANQCVFFDTLSITIHPLPIASAGKDSIICYNTEIRLATQNAATSGTAPYSFLWLPNVDFVNPDTQTSPSPLVKPSADTHYYLKITDAQGCTASDSVFIKINPKTSLNAGADRALCIGDSTLLGGNPTAQNSLFPYFYQWLPTGETTSTFYVKPTISGTYTLIVSTRDCNPDTARVSVVVNPLPKPTTDPLDGDTTIGANEVIFIKALGGVQYAWFPTEGLDNANSDTPIASPSLTTLYIVTVTDINGCKQKDSVKVSVRNQLFIPNTFTPNDDNHNDEFKVFGTGIDQISLIVFDRTGEKLFETTSKDKGWDGKFNGNLLPTGAYQWVISGRFYDGEIISFNGETKGTIQLIR